MPTFNLTLQLCREEHEIHADEPTIIDDKLINQTWNMLGLFVEETLDDLNVEANETRFREIVVELAYRLILREMTTLRELPMKGRLATAKPKSRRARRQKGDS